MRLRKVFSLCVALAMVVTLLPAFTLPAAVAALPAGSIEVPLTAANAVPGGGNNTTRQAEDIIYHTDGSVSFRTTQQFNSFLSFFIIVIRAFLS